MMDADEPEAAPTIMPATPLAVLQFLKEACADLRRLREATQKLKGHAAVLDHLDDALLPPTWSAESHAEDLNDLHDAVDRHLDHFESAYYELLGRQKGQIKEYEDLLAKRRAVPKTPTEACTHEGVGLPGCTICDHGAAADQEAS